ncbi:putative cupin superfamily protein [Pseudomonas sp. ADAK2 TE3594]
MINKVIKTVFSWVSVSVWAVSALGICHANDVPTRHSMPIEKNVPASVKTVNAPDSDPQHYQVMNGTHFSYRCHVPYTAKSQQAAVEVCEIDPVKLKLLSWPETEVINLISGNVTITELGGTVVTYAAGDIFVLPQGFKGIWDQPLPITKVTVRHPLYWKD